MEVAAFFRVNQIIEKRRVEHIIQCVMQIEIHADRHRDRNNAQNTGGQIGKQIFDLTLPDQVYHDPKDQGEDDQRIVNAHKCDQAYADPVKIRIPDRMLFMA